ncbi:hypothetical protein ACWDUL_24185 [Nocardia niigatensis]
MLEVDAEHDIESVIGKRVDSTHRAGLPRWRWSAGRPENARNR